MVSRTGPSPPRGARSDVVAASAANLAVHFTWVQERVPGMRVRRDGTLVLADSGLACDTFNAACGARLSGEAEDRIAEAIAWFGGRPFSWWHAPGDTPGDLDARLEAAGLVRAEGELAMWVPLDRLAAAEPPRSLEIRRVRTAGDLERFARLLAALWSPPDPDVVAFYRLGQSALLAKGCPIRLHLGWWDGAPVATAEATAAGGVVGLYNVSTDPGYRGRGIGSAMTAAPLVEARARGIAAGVLQAAPEGVGVYRRVGFAAFGEVVEYKPPALAPPAARG